MCSFHLVLQSIKLKVQILKIIHSKILKMVKIQMKCNLLKKKIKSLNKIKKNKKNRQKKLTENKIFDLKLKGILKQRRLDYHKLIQNKSLNIY